MCELDQEPLIHQCGEAGYKDKYCNAIDMTILQTIKNDTNRKPCLRLAMDENDNHRMPRAPSSEVRLWR